MGPFPGRDKAAAQTDQPALDDPFDIPSDADVTELAGPQTDADDFQPDPAFTQPGTATREVATAGPDATPDELVDALAKTSTFNSVTQTLNPMEPAVALDPATIPDALDAAQERLKADADADDDDDTSSKRQTAYRLLETLSNGQILDRGVITAASWKGAIRQAVDAFPGLEGRREFLGGLATDIREQGYGRKTEVVEDWS